MCEIKFINNSSSKQEIKETIEKKEVSMFILSGESAGYARKIIEDQIRKGEQISLVVSDLQNDFISSINKKDVFEKDAYYYKNVTNE
jgi:hypothetical protein